MNNQWVSKKSEKLPDFIIGGAMKSGTTTLHQILDKHPNVYMAEGEIGFFDVDNIIEHPDFNFFDENGIWYNQNINKNPDLAWKWYYDKFHKAENRIIGEDSTTYLASSMAAKRIGMQSKPIKMIFILRHPTERTISNYYHLLKSGRAEYNLEDTLQYNPYSIIRRSLYLDQLKNYYKHLYPENIKVVLFEDFLNDTQSVLKEVCDFLNISLEKFSSTDIKIHVNKTVYPKSQKIQLLYNRLNRSIGKSRYSNLIPFKEVESRQSSFKEMLLKKIHKKINPKHEDYKPKINPQTKKYLDEFFIENLNGIDELTGKEIFSKWFNL